MKKMLIAAGAFVAATAPANAATTILADLTADGTKAFTFTSTGGASSIAVNSTAVTAGGIGDPSIWVFANDLNGAFIAYNDDFNGLNSFVSLNLAAGTYVATVGRFSFSQSEARSGIANYNFGETGFEITFSDGLSVSAGVPEPATWAMLMLGFGLVGAAARRRKGVAAIA